MTIGKFKSPILLFASSAMIFLLAASIVVMVPLMQTAEAAPILSAKESSKYKIHMWHYNKELGRMTGFIVSEIIIENETFDKVEGYVADSRGMRLDFSYDLQSVIAEYLYSNGGVSEPEFFGLTHDGYFAVTKPNSTMLTAVRINIGPADYLRDTANVTHMRAMVFVNPAWMEYKVANYTSNTNSTGTDYAKSGDPTHTKVAQERLWTRYDPFTYEISHCYHLMDIGSLYNQCLRLHKTIPDAKILEYLNQLIDEVDSHGLSTHLLERAKSILGDYRVDNNYDACRKLFSFLNLVESEAGKRLTYPEADDIIRSVEELRYKANC